MKTFVVGCVAAMVLAVPGAAAAQSSQDVFQCTLRNGKTVRVTAEGGELVYRYGTPARAELTLRASAQSGTARFMRQRYAGPQSQLRFTNGGYSYIVHNMEGNGNTGANGVSGLVVMHGDRRLADHSCRRWTGFSGGFDLLESLPEDSEEWTAM